MPGGHLEINRTFLKYGADTYQSESQDAFQFDLITERKTSIGWADILKQKLVVVLGEPGIGKTSEFKSQHRRLTDAGELSIYVRLEDLLKRELIEVIEPEEFKLLKAAAENQRRIFVFLDAVDEAKIRDYHGFEDALRNASLSLRNYLDFSYVVISSRIRSWREQVDEDLIVKYLGSANQLSKSQAQISTAISALKSVTIAGAKIEVGRDKSQEARGERDKAIHVYELAPLSREQFTEYARFRLIENRRIEQLEDFLDAVDSQDAWDFASRPIDADAIIQYWQDRGRLDSRQVLIEANISRKLEEANQSHGRKAELSNTEARLGASALALGAILCRQANLLTIDNADLYRRAEDAIDPRQILTRWNHAKIMELFERSIFVSASFSKTQFFHRNYTEYLAADCLKQLSNLNLSLGELNSVIFRPAHNSKFVPTSLRPVVAWLSSAIREVRSQVLKIDPMLLLEHGDLSSLAASERIQILNAMTVEKHPSLRRIDWRYLKRLASNSIASAVNCIILDSDKSADAREIAISIAKHGRLARCRAAVLAIATADFEDTELRIDGIIALKELGAADDLERLVAHQKKRFPISAREAAAICRACYPAHMSEADLISLLQKVSDARSDGFQASWLEREIIESIPRLTTIRLQRLVNGLSRLSQKGPWKSKTSPQNKPLSDKYDWYCDLLFSAIRNLLSKAETGELNVVSVAAAIEQLREMRDFQHRFGSKDSKLDNELLRHPKIRRRLFWNRVDNRLASGREVAHRIQVNDTYDLWHLEITDNDWLLADALHNHSRDKKVVAFRIATQLAFSARDKNSKLKLKRIAEANDIFRKTLSDEWPGQLKRLLNVAKYKWEVIKYSGNIYKIQRKLESVKIWLVVIYGVCKHIANLGELKSFPALWNLYVVGRGENASSRYGEIGTQNLRKKFGCIMAAVAKRGFKKFWRLYCPPLPAIGSNSTPNVAIIGLTGLDLEFGDNEDFSGLTSAEARIAAHYALHEINGFPRWFAGLLNSYPDEVCGVLHEQIRVEMQTLPTVENSFGMLGDLAYHDLNISERSRPSVWAELSVFEPPNLHVLNHALLILLRGDSSYRDQIAGISLDRITQARHRGDEDRLLFWLRVWLQVDAVSAIEYLEDFVAGHENAREFLAKIASGLDRDRTGSLTLDNPSFIQFAVLKRLIRLLYKYLNPRLEEPHTGVITPDIYYDAGQFRSKVFRYLVEARDDDVYAELIDLSEEPDFENIRDNLITLARERAASDAETKPMTTFQVAQFFDQHYLLPQNQDDLFRTIQGRLADLREISENGDFSLRGVFEKKSREASIQKWVANSLEAASRDCYQVVRELEVFNNKRPDIRVFRASVGYVTIEIKKAHDYNFEDLIQDALLDQLIGRYMRVNRSRHGILLLVNLQKNKLWPIGPGTNVDLPRLVELLNKRADSICENWQSEIHVKVIGIDLSPVK